MISKNITCFRAQRLIWGYILEKLQKRYMAYYLNEIHILIGGNIHENFKNLVTFFVIFTVFRSFAWK